jgi:hypothetical protein
MNRLSSRNSIKDLNLNLKPPKTVQFSNISSIEKKTLYTGSLNAESSQDYGSVKVAIDSHNDQIIVPSYSE